MERSLVEALKFAWRLPYLGIIRFMGILLLHFLTSFGLDECDLKLFEVKFLLDFAVVKVYQYKNTTWSTIC